MAFQNQKVFSKAKLNLVRKIFPVKLPEISLLDKLDLDLPKTKINQINIPSIIPPRISEDYCPEEKDITKIETSPFYFVANTCEECGYNFFVRIDYSFIGEKVKITCPKCKKQFVIELSDDFIIQDLTSWLKDQILVPEIVSIPLLFKKPRRGGKTFRKEHILDQKELFTQEEESEECIHGLKKSWCSICMEKERCQWSFKNEPFSVVKSEPLSH